MEGPLQDSGLEDGRESVGEGKNSRGGEERVEEKVGSSDDEKVYIVLNVRT